MDEMILVIVIGAVVVLAIQALIATKFEEIANSKGYQGYFWWCFLLGIIGWIMVLCLPKRNNADLDGSNASQSTAQTQNGQATHGPDDGLPPL